MTSDDRFEALLAGMLADIAPTREPDRLVPDILRAARRERRWPRWLALIKEPPMRISSRVAVGSPALRIASIMALTLALILAIGAAVVAGASLLPSPAPSVPLPYGAAVNGSIIYAQDGDITTVDADGGNPRVIVAGTMLDDSPGYSPDGTRIAFIRHGDGVPTLMVARSDGSDPVSVAPFSDSSWYEWTPDGTRFVVTQESTSGRTLSILEADGSGDSHTLDLQGVTPDSWVVPRPPDGAELIFGGYSPVDGSGQVYAIRPDGTGLRQIGDLPRAQDVFMGANVSPDGTTVAFWNAETTRDPRVTTGFQDASLHLLDLDTGADRLVQLDPVSRAEKKPVWSPDGTSLAFLSVERGQVVIAPVDGTGPATPIGRIFSNSDDYEYGFSPDGTVLLEGVFDVGPSGSGQTSFYDVATGEVTRVLDIDIPSWQRLAFTR